MDGSVAEPLPIDLEGVSGPGVLTRVRVVRVGAVRAGSLAADCLRGPARDARPAGHIVERIGVDSETVTLRDPSSLSGCDNSPGVREENRRWCGSSFGRLYGGRLRDPRVDIAGCRTADGTPLGLAWIEPGRDARYVVIGHTGYAEVYAVAGALPVRIATIDVHVEGSRASFAISEHDSQGRLLRRYELDAFPAG
jgi:hypothetical protein